MCNYFLQKRLELTSVGEVFKKDFFNTNSYEKLGAAKLGSFFTSNKQIFHANIFRDESQKYFSSI